MERQNRKRMKAYAPDEHQYKFKATPSGGREYKNRQDKLIARNANRALKKSVRQEAKRNALDELAKLSQELGLYDV